ncbi:MAG TPA: chromosome segregation SMC family protein, partial [Trueperaceae bacterium]|nr:chromosome segregation SMC family protein [Trueperaceae bacterium]
MRIVSLTLQGFKSFGDRATIEFADGVTAIVGPNGSGKSNIIDALRWTTGGGRASSFRADDKTDLIFHGATGKRRVGLAEVEIELKDGNRSLKLARTLDREGTTRLRLNGRAARFLDVEEALAGSGLGRAGLAVIGQGEVSEVLMADPARLLDYVSEAAGAARLSTRRDQAQGRLDTAGSHLDRLQDLLRDLQARCDALATEARDAKRHAELSTQALHLRFTAASARQESLLQEIAQLNENRARLETRLAEGRSAMAHTRTLLEAARGAHDRSQDKLRAAAADLEARRGDVRLAEERLANSHARLAALKRQAEANATETARLEATDAPSEPDRSVLQGRERVASQHEELKVATAALERAREELRKASGELEAKRQRAGAFERAVATYESRLASLREQRAALQQRLEQATAAEPAADLAVLEQADEKARAARSEASIALERRRQELAEVHSRQALAAAEAMSSTRAAERLRAAHEARRGYTQGPRAALSSGLAGVVGSVADLVRVAPEYQQALSAALGRRAEYVVVDTAETAERILAHVKESGGYVTVLPLDLL